MRLYLLYAKEVRIRVGALYCAVVWDGASQNEQENVVATEFLNMLRCQMEIVLCSHPACALACEEYSRNTDVTF